MGLVLDASVVVKWFIDEQGSEAARGVLVSGRQLLAPELVIAEVGNAAWRRARLGEIPLQQAVSAAEQVGRSPIEFRPLAALARQALEWPRRSIIQFTIVSISPWRSNATRCSSLPMTAFCPGYSQQAGGHAAKAWYCSRRD